MATDTLIKPTTVRYWAYSDNFGIPRVRGLDDYSGGGHSTPNKEQYDRYYIQFRNNQFETQVGAKPLVNPKTGEEEDEIAFLERQPSFGVHFFRQDEQPPPAADAHDLIQEALIEEDLEALVQLVEVEAANWRRPEVGSAAASALQRLGRKYADDDDKLASVRDAFDQVVALGAVPPDEG